MIQLCIASTLYGTATLAAAVDAGQLGTPRRRLLVVTNNAETPEAQPGPNDQPGFDTLARRFDAVVSWNEVVYPFHPTEWRPRAGDATMWQRLLCHAWGLDDGPMELVMESIQAPPAATLASIFLDATIRLYSDGLMAYGPTRRVLSPQVGGRLREVLHLDLIPGLTPLVAREFDPVTTPVPQSAIADVLAEVSAATTIPDGLPRNCALIVGQYLASAGLLSDERERALYTAMVHRAIALGHSQIVFKPHPTAPEHWQQHLKQAAAAAGAELAVVTNPCLAEVLYERLRPAVVIGCFSTALLTASTFYGLPVARLGSDLMYDQLTPYANSNRIPVVLVHALVPELAAGVAPGPLSCDVHHLGRLVATVAYCMQPGVCDDLWPIAVEELRADPARYRRLVPRSRLMRLGLPGAPLDLSPILANAPLRRGVRRLIGAPRGIRRRLSRVLA